MDATDNDPAGKRRRGGAGLAVVLLAAAALLYVVMSREDQTTTTDAHPAVGRRLQFLRFEPLTGDSKSVSSDDLVGRVTLVNYWGTWCGPCIREFPELVELAARFGKQADFRFLPVSCGSGDDSDLELLRVETQEFLSEHHAADLATYADQNAASRRAMIVELNMSPGNFAYPTTILFDRQGRIRAFWEGYSPHAVHEMARKVDELLNER